jgi:hypothetical protein
MRQPRIEETKATDRDRGRSTAPLSRRRLLWRVALALAPFAALAAGACDKPYYDRDRGVFVWRRPGK